MQENFRSAQDCLDVALRLAKNGRFTEARQMLDLLQDRELTPYELRILANVTSRCGMFDRTVSTWEQLDRIGEILPGDRYMQGMAHTELSNMSHAIRCFEQELALVDQTGDQTFFQSAAFLLAYWLIKSHDLQRAGKILDLIQQDGDTFFVPNLGVRTKADMIAELGKSA